MDELRNALSQSHPHDLQAIRQYIRWLRFRRVVHHLFYFQAHWVKSGRRYHWLGGY